MSVASSAPALSPGSCSDRIRELIRLKYQAGLSHEQIAGALGISKGVVAKYVGRIERAGFEPGELLRSDPRTDPTEVPGRSLARADCRGAGDLQGRSGQVCRSHRARRL